MSLNPYQSPNVRNDASRPIVPRRRGNGAIWCLYAATALFLFCGFLPCSCGYLDRWALLVTVPGAVFAWLSVIFADKRRTLFLLATVAVAIVLSLALLKNVGDVLWYGHDALWPRQIPGAPTL